MLHLTTVLMLDARKTLFVSAVTITVGMIVSGCSCNQENRRASATLDRKASFQPTYKFQDRTLTVGGEKWRESVIIGWGDYAYQLRKRDMVIQTALSITGEGTSSVLNHIEAARLRQDIYTRHVESSVLVFRAPLSTQFGMVFVYREKSPSGRANDLALYQDKNGDVTEVAFFKKKSETSLSEIVLLLNSMYTSGVIPGGLNKHAETELLSLPTMNHP